MFFYIAAPGFLSLATRKKYRTLLAHKKHLCIPLSIRCKAEQNTSRIQNYLEESKNQIPINRNFTLKEINMNSLDTLLFIVISLGAILLSLFI